LSKWPALDVAEPVDPDLTLALVDDFSPTAIESRDNSLRFFFTTARARDAACAALEAAQYRNAATEVDDEDWARRSQESLKPIAIGRITVAPDTSHPAPDTTHPAPGTAPATRHEAPGTIVIRPSMGFGTGHHATTRLCLHALQALEVTGRFLLDIGTGSGVLAIAAVRLGAARAIGIDYDVDAIRAANENLQLNSGVESIEFRVADLSTDNLPKADVVTANLTGATLIRSAVRLLDLVTPGGTLIVSGLLEDERDDVLGAFAGPNKVRPTPGEVVRPTSGDAGRTLSGVGRTLSGPPMLLWEQHEDGWVALAMKRS